MMKMKVGSSDWSEAEAALSTAGVKRIPQAIDAAKRNRLTPADLIGFAFIAQHFADVGPGAIVDRIKFGHWFRDGIPDLDELKEQIARRKEHHRTEQEDSERRLVAKDLCDLWRKSGNHSWTDEQLTAAVDGVIAKRQQRENQNAPENVAEQGSGGAIDPLIAEAKKLRLNSEPRVTFQRPPPAGVSANRQRNENEKALAQIHASNERPDP